LDLWNDIGKTELEILKMIPQQIDCTAQQIDCTPQHLLWIAVVEFKPW
jgi:hypothetical protein